MAEALRETLTIRLHVAGRDVGASDYLTNLGATVEGLRQISAAIGQAAAIRIIETRRDNPFCVTVDAPAGAIGRWLAICEAAERREPMPLDLEEDERVLESAKRAISVLDGDVTRILYESGTRSVEPTLQAVANIALLLRPQTREHTEITTLRGWLHDVYTHNIEKSKFVIYDTLTDEKVSCIFKPGDLKKVLKNIRRRVAVTGLAHYDESGKPRLIEATSFRALRTSDQLPQLGDMKGINITGGMESSEYVRKSRDDET